VLRPCPSHATPRPAALFLCARRPSTRCLGSTVRRISGSARRPPDARIQPLTKDVPAAAVIHATDAHRAVVVALWDDPVRVVTHKLVGEPLSWGAGATWTATDSTPRLTSWRVSSPTRSRLALPVPAWRTSRPPHRQMSRCCVIGMAGWSTTSALESWTPGATGSITSWRPRPARCWCTATSTGSTSCGTSIDASSWRCWTSRSAAWPTGTSTSGTSPETRTRPT
jgi:hypothetical protein